MFYFVFLTLVFRQELTKLITPPQIFDPSFLVVSLAIFSLALLIVGLFTLFLLRTSKPQLESMPIPSKGNAKSVEPFSSNSQQFRVQHTTFLSLFFVALAAITLFVTWLNGPLSVTGPVSFTPVSTRVSLPSVNGLVRSGVLTIGSDTSLLPQNFVDNHNQPVGFDAILISSIAQKMNLKPKIVPIDYNNLLDSLRNKKVDVVISAYAIDNVPKENFSAIPYLNPSETLLFPKGNPQNLKFVSLNDLCGARVSVLSGSSEEIILQNATKKCIPLTNGIKIVHEVTIEAVMNDLEKSINGVQAAFLDSPTSTYYLQQASHQNKIEIAGKPLQGKPEGILMLKEHYPLFNAVQFALNLTIQDQTYSMLLTKLHMDADAVPTLF